MSTVISRALMSALQTLKRTQGDSDVRVTEADLRKVQAAARGRRTDEDDEEDAGDRDERLQ